MIQRVKTGIIAGVGRETTYSYRACINRRLLKKIPPPLNKTTKLFYHGKKLFTVIWFTTMYWNYLGYFFSIINEQQQHFNICQKKPNLTGKRMFVTLHAACLSTIIGWFVQGATLDRDDSRRVIILCSSNSIHLIHLKLRITVYSVCWDALFLLSTPLHPTPTHPETIDHNRLKVASVTKLCCRTPK